MKKLIEHLKESIISEAKTYDVEKVLSVIASLAGVKSSDIEDGKRLVISGFPANIKDKTSDGTIDLEAVDAPAAKGIKGALMKKGITSKIHNQKIVFIDVE